MSASVFDSFERYIIDQGFFSKEEILTIKSLAISKQIKKKQFLLRQGEICRFHTFVCNGCLRSYRIDDSGKEHILSFLPANHWVADHLSLVTGTPSEEFIDALEDSDIIQFSVDSFRALLKDIPSFNMLNTKIIAGDCNKNRDRIYMMIRDQAVERYRYFIHRFPQLHKRVPIFMIASYLGVTRETLTRIRSNMLDL